MVYKVDLFSDGLDVQGNERPETTESSGKTSERRAGTDQTDQGMGECASFSGGLRSNTCLPRVRQ